jgi:hypothetical protein
MTFGNGGIAVHLVVDDKSSDSNENSLGTYSGSLVLGDSRTDVPYRRLLGCSPVLMLPPRAL